VKRSAAGRVLPILLSTYLALAACDSPAAHPLPSTPATAPSASAAPSPTTPSPSASPSPPPVKPKVRKAALAYFLAIGIGAEYGDKVKVVTMWSRPVVTVRVHGGNAASKRCLNTVIADFNALTTTTDLRVSTNPADIELHFAPLSKFRSILPGYPSGNDGYVDVRWNGFYIIQRATVLIRSTGISERIRCHLIREELTQGMGLLRDSYKYPESIFYQAYTSPTRYAAIDKEVIRLLYSGAIQPGDDKKAIAKAVSVT
jgi:hypothetical protein